MSKEGFSRAFFDASSDPEARMSILKDVNIRTLEKIFKNKLEDVKSFDAIILRLEASRNVVGSSNGTTLVDERPLFYKAVLRILGVHDEILPNPCDYSDVDVQQTLISLHVPQAISTAISPDMAARYNLKPGKIVSCKYNPGPNQLGAQRGLTFEPASVGSYDPKEYPCLGRRTRLMRGGFANDPKLYFKAQQQEADPTYSATPTEALDLVLGMTAEDYIGKKILKGIPAQPPKQILLDNAMIAYMRHYKQLTNKKLITMVDFSIPGKNPRMWVIDANTKEIKAWVHTSHGSNSGGKYGGIPTSFSNIDGSHQTSLGAAKTGNRYRSQKYNMMWTVATIGLDGPCLNDRSKSRGNLMHRADYAAKGGRSWGCYGIHSSISDDIISAISGGSLLYSFYDGKGEAGSTKNDSRCPQDKRNEYIEKYEKLYNYYQDNKDDPLKWNENIFNAEGWLND